MSDLAPFVAAVLWDKTLADLQTEISRLKKYLPVVEIKGPGGSPLYSKSTTMDCIDAKKLKETLQTGLSYQEDFDILNILDLEVHVIGEKIVTIREIAQDENWSYSQFDGRFYFEMVNHSKEGNFRKVECSLNFDDDDLLPLQKKSLADALRDQRHEYYFKSIWGLQLGWRFRDFGFSLEKAEAISKIAEL